MYILDKSQVDSFDVRQHGVRDVRAQVVGLPEEDVPFNVGSVVVYGDPEPHRFMVLQVKRISNHWTAELKSMDSNWIPEGQAPITTPSISHAEAHGLISDVRGVSADDDDDDSWLDDVEEDLPDIASQHGPYSVVAFEQSYHNNFKNKEVFPFHCPVCKSRGIMEAPGEHECSCGALLYCTYKEQYEKILAAPPPQAATPSSGRGDKKPRKSKKPPEIVENIEKKDTSSSISDISNRLRNFRFGADGEDEEDED